MAVCPGSGKKWIPGTGAPICPYCHRGPDGLKAKKPTRRKLSNGKMGFTGSVPKHELRKN